MFPEFSIYIGEYNVIRTERNDGQNYQNKTQVVMNLSFPLNI